MDRRPASGEQPTPAASELGRASATRLAAGAGIAARPRIVIVIDHYLPGTRTGGPVRTVAATVERLGDEFEFVVLTGDRDRGDAAPYPGVAPGVAARAGKADVRYLAPRCLRPLALAGLIEELRPGVVCLNGFFARTSRSALLARRAGRLGGVPVVVAPRGDFSPGALALKRSKKSRVSAVGEDLGPVPRGDLAGEQRARGAGHPGGDRAGAGAGGSRSWSPATW